VDWKVILKLFSRAEKWPFSNIIIQQFKTKPKNYIEIKTENYKKEQKAQILKRFVIMAIKINYL
jgi:hypothetical protein